MSISKSEKQKRYDIFLQYCERHSYRPISNEYKRADEKLFYECPKHGEQYTTFVRIQLDQGCKYCGYEHQKITKTKSTDEVRGIIESKNNNQWMNPGDYIDVTTKNLIIKCGSCGDIFTTYFDNYQQTSGKCPKCKKKRYENMPSTLTQDEVKARIEAVNNNKWLNYGEYVNSVTQNLKILCGCCGENIFITRLGNYGETKVSCCTLCSNRKSKGEIMIQKYLDNINEPYIPEHRFYDCVNIRTLPFDFYLPEKRICIEFDGLQHYKPIKLYGGEEGFLYRQKMDRIKTEYCKENQIQLIRIPYYDIDNIPSILDQYFLKQSA